MPIISGPLGPSGIVLDVRVALSETSKYLFAQRRVSAPEPIFARAMIDTGSSSTMFASSVFRQLKLSPIGKVPIHTPSTTIDVPCFTNRYRVEISFIANGGVHRLGELTVIEGDMSHEEDGVVALIGRDLLSRVMFIYDGLDERFELHF